MSSERYQLIVPPPQSSPSSPLSPTPPSTLPFASPQPYPSHTEILQFDLNAAANAAAVTGAAAMTGAVSMVNIGHTTPTPNNNEPHNTIEWKYHTHRPETDGDSLGRKAGKRKLVIPRDLLKMKQMNAALKIGIPPSTFSKRWRESLPDRTWPYRNHRRIEKNIKMLKTMQQKGHDVAQELGKMTQQQEENLAPAVIDVYEDVNEEYLMKNDDKKPAAPLPSTPSTPLHSPYPLPSHPAPSTPSTPHHAPYPLPSHPPPPQQPLVSPQQSLLQITSASSHLIPPHLVQSPQTKFTQHQPPQLSPVQPPPIQTQPSLVPQTTSMQVTPIQAMPIQPTFQPPSHPNDIGLVSTPPHSSSLLPPPLHSPNVQPPSTQPIPTSVQPAPSLQATSQSIQAQIISHSILPSTSIPATTPQAIPVKSEILHLPPPP